jgi:hypothetical protein
MKKIPAVITLAFLHMVLAGCGQQQTSAASADPCEFEGQIFCVDEAGDVYYTPFKYVAAGTPRCIGGEDWSMCPGVKGKIPPGDTLPVDVCGNGTYRAPCDPK